MTFSALAKRCDALHQALGNAHWAVCEAKPPTGDLHLVGRLADVLLELMSQARRCQRMCLSAARAESRGAAESGQILRRCQASIDAIGSRLLTELLSYEVIREILGTKRHGDAWRGWAKEVRKALGKCRLPLDEVRRALLACWRMAISQRAANLVVKTTSVGQVLQVRRPVEAAMPREPKSSRRPRGMSARPAG